jgi:hypothetical protein
MIAYMETFVAPLTLEDLPESFHPTLKAVRSLAGETLVLDENMFIEKMLAGVTQRALSADEMAEYRRPPHARKDTYPLSRRFFFFDTARSGRCESP